MSSFARSSLRTRLAPLAAALTIWLALAAPVEAHTPSTGYLRLSTDGTDVEGTLEFAVRDLASAVLLDQDGDRRILWGEIENARPALAALVAERLILRRADAACTTNLNEPMVDRRDDGAWLVVPLVATCAGEGALSVDYRFFFDQDPTHRGLLALTRESASATRVAGPDDHLFTFEPDTVAAGGFATYFAYGVEHLLIGPDHLLFLAVLLLPLLTATSEPLRKRVWTFGTIVTAFTVAHAIALLLAITGVVSLPGRLVESAIAATIVLTALDNLWRFLPAKRWQLAFGFGLIHGLGFAAVLLPLGLPAGGFWPAFAGFNLGIEAGQIAVAALLWLPLLVWSLRPPRSSLLLRAGSIAACGAGLLWLIDRALALGIIVWA
ncbi:MAG: HupE/UreJ family protein [Geminicoccaceae bacterium]|nr:HupE/UreJ family protein [Geminicoccaceae bacterium]